MLLSATYTFCLSASAPIALPHRHDRGARATIRQDHHARAVFRDLYSLAGVPMASAAEKIAVSTNHADASFSNDVEMDRSHSRMELQNALDGMHYFDKICFKARY